jgi:hypothetical protein
MVGLNKLSKLQLVLLESQLLLLESAASSGRAPRPGMLFPVEKRPVLRDRRLNGVQVVYFYTMRMRRESSKVALSTRDNDVLLIFLASTDAVVSANKSCGTCVVNTSKFCRTPSQVAC